MDTIGVNLKNGHGRKSKKILFFTVFILILGLWFYGDKLHMFFTAKGYQAVFLSNGQIYFGKLSVSGKWLHLSDIYYLQSSDALQEGSSSNANQNIQLIKLGRELHGPTDSMYIERDKVLFWENLKDDSKVVGAINKSKNN